MEFKTVTKFSCIITVILLACSVPAFGMTTPMTFPQYITAWNQYEKSVNSSAPNATLLQPILSDLQTVAAPNAGALRFLAGKLLLLKTADKSSVIAALQAKIGSAVPMSPPAASPAPTSPAPTSPALAPVTPTTVPAAPTTPAAPVVSPVSSGDSESVSVEKYKPLVTQLKSKSLTTYAFQKRAAQQNLREMFAADQSNMLVIDYLIEALIEQAPTSFENKDAKVAAINKAIAEMSFPDPKEWLYDEAL